MNSLYIITAKSQIQLSINMNSSIYIYLYIFNHSIFSLLPPCCVYYYKIKSYTLPILIIEQHNKK